MGAAPPMGPPALPPSAAPVTGQVAPRRRPPGPAAYESNNSQIDQAHAQHIQEMWKNTTEDKGFANLSPQGKMAAYNATAQYAQAQGFDPAQLGLFPPVDPQTGKDLYPPGMTDQAKALQENRQADLKYEQEWTNNPANAHAAPDVRAKHFARLSQLQDALTPGAPPVPQSAPGTTPGEDATAAAARARLTQQAGFHSEDEQDKAASRGIEKGRLALEQSNATNKQGSALMYFDSIDRRIADLRAREQAARPVQGSGLPGLPGNQPSADQIAKWRATVGPWEQEIQNLAQQKADAAIKYGVQLPPELPPAPAGSISTSGKPLGPPPPGYQKPGGANPSTPKKIGKYNVTFN